MSNLHHFDEAGYYTGTTEVPVNPVTGKPFAINEAVATFDPIPTYSLETERVRRVDGVWVVEAIPEPEPEVDPKPQEPVKPTYCTPAQGLVALFAVKQITEDDLLAAINQIPDPVEQYTAKIGLQRATLWERQSNTMQNMATLLGLTEQDLDELFEYAVNVSV